MQEIKSKSKYSRQNPASDFPNFAKPLAGDAVMSIKIYCNDRVRIETAWKEFKRMINANIQDMTIGDDVIKKITGRDREKIRKLERDFDVEIQVNQRKGNLRIRGHIADILNTHDQIWKLLKDIKDRENKGKLLQIICKMPDSAIALLYFTVVKVLKQHLNCRSAWAWQWRISRIN